MTEMITRRPWLSIAIAMYNAERFLDKCLSSILHQSFQNFEVIIVDDGSTDDSLTIAREYAAKDERIRVYANAHKGAYSTKAEALEHGRGEYVLSCDADDYFIKNAFQTLYDIVKNTNYELVQFNYWYKYNHVRFRNKLQYSYVTYDSETFQREEYIRMLCGELEQTKLKGYLWCKLIHCRLLKNIPPPSKRVDFFMGDDRLLNMYLLKDCRSALFVNNPLYVYRVLSGNSARFRKNGLKDSDYLKECQLSFLDDYSPQLQARAKQKLYTNITRELFYFAKESIKNTSIEETEQYLRESLSLPTFVKAIEYFRNNTDINDYWINLVRLADPNAYIDAVQASIQSESILKKTISRIKQIIKSII